MDQAAMVETELTQVLVTEGAALIAKLDAAGAPPDAAAWVYFPDKGAWKLLLAEARLASAGPREIYREIQKALMSLRKEVVHLSLEDVTVAELDAPLVKALRHAVTTGPGTGGFRLTRNVINGTMIEDAYIYRRRRPAA